MTQPPTIRVTFTLDDKLVASYPVQLTKPQARTLQRCPRILHEFLLLALKTVTLLGDKTQ